MILEPELARTVAVIAEAGTLDAAAVRLHVTPSAVSQRLRVLERELGRPVLHRTRPVELTDAGRALVRFARQLDELAADLDAELAPGPAGRPVPLTVVVNADSLHTWALPALVSVSDRVALEVIREDQGHSLDLLRDGRAAGAVTAESRPLPGCAVEPLGVMRYRGVCSPGYAERWLPDGASADALARAPLLRFDAKDDLQDRCLAALGAPGATPPVHAIPASAEFATAIELGMGWGTMPEIEAAAALDVGRLVPLGEAAVVDVALFWQRWRRGSAAVRAVGDALRDAAAVLR